MPNASVLATGGALPSGTAFYEITPATRRRVELAVESLLALLDDLDGDLDFEPIDEDDECGHDAETVNEDGDDCDAGEPDGHAFFEPWNGFRASARGPR